MSAQEIVFRRAGMADAALLSRTRQSAWAATYRGIYPDEWIDGYDFAAQAVRERARLQQPGYEAYVAMDGGECAGYFSYGPPVHGAYKDFALCLNSLYFLPGYQRRGLGSRVFAQMRQAARSRGLDRFFCGCNLHNEPARRFYEAMGGKAGKTDGGHDNRAEDQVYFEFYLGEPK